MNPIALIQALFVELLDCIDALLSEFYAPMDGLVRYTLTKLRENVSMLYEQMHTYYNELIAKVEALDSEKRELEMKLYDLQTANALLQRNAQNHALQLQSWMKLVPIEVLIPDEQVRETTFHYAVQEGNHIGAIKWLRATKHEFGHFGLKEAKDLYELRFRKQPEPFLTIRGSHGDFGVDAMGVPTGKIPEAYKNIVEVNVGEYSLWTRQALGEELKKGAETDILLVEYWYREDGMKQVQNYDPGARAHAVEAKMKSTEG